MVKTITSYRKPRCSIDVKETGLLRKRRTMVVTDGCTINDIHEANELTKTALQKRPIQLSVEPLGLVTRIAKFVKEL